VRVIVTGGAGFIGRPVVRHLRDAGHEVQVIDVRPHEERESRVDVLDYHDLRGALAGAEVVYHLAGPVLEMARGDPYNSSRLQFQGTLNVLEASIAEEVSKVLVASSFYVYDGIPADDIVNEYSPINSSKMELFGALKVMAEQLTLAYHRRFGMRYVILRFGSAFGAGEGSNLIQTFLEAALRGEPLEVWGPGERLNQYTYIEDLAAGCVAALEAENEIVNLISPEETSTGEVARLMQERYGFEVRFLLDKPEGASVPYMSSRKAVRQLGWRPTPFVDALDRLHSELRDREARESLTT
jgi:UDP-glucose 4-epimerase